MNRTVVPIPKIDSDLTEKEILEECRDLFQKLKGVQARQDLQFLRGHVPETHPLRFKGEYCFYCMRHTPSETEFKKQYQRRGHYPVYSWEKR